MASFTLNGKPVEAEADPRTPLRVIALTRTVRPDRNVSCSPSATRAIHTHSRSATTDRPNDHRRGTHRRLNEVLSDPRPGHRMAIDIAERAACQLDGSRLT